MRAKLLRAKLLGGAAALTLMAGALLASTGQASAQYYGPGWGYGYDWGWGPGAVAADIVGGAVAAATSPLWAPGYYDYYSGPGYAYGPAYVAPAYAPPPVYAAPDTTAVAESGPTSDGVAYCESRFRSYDPATGMYLGYDGRHHPCP